MKSNKIFLVFFLSSICFSTHIFSMLQRFSRAEKGTKMLFSRSLAARALPAKLEVTLYPYDPAMVIAARTIPKIVKALLDAKVDINEQNSKGKTALHVTRNFEIAKLLVEHGADLKIVDQDGLTPLQRAIANFYEQGTTEELENILKIIKYLGPKSDPTFETTQDYEKDFEVWFAYGVEYLVRRTFAPSYFDENEENPKKEEAF